MHSLVGHIDVCSSLLQFLNAGMPQLLLRWTSGAEGSG